MDEYSEEELREIEDYMEVPTNQYVHWIRLHYPFTLKRKRRVKQFSENITVTNKPQQMY